MACFLSKSQWRLHAAELNLDCLFRVSEQNRSNSLSTLFLHMTGKEKKTQCYIQLTWAWTDWISQNPPAAQRFSLRATRHNLKDAWTDLNMSLFTADAYTGVTDNINNGFVPFKSWQRDSEPACSYPDTYLSSWPDSLYYTCCVVFQM